MDDSSACLPNECWRTTCSRSCWEKRLSVANQREAVRLLVDGGLSVPRACALDQIPRSTFLYSAKPEDDQALLAHIRELVAQHPRLAIAASVSSFDAPPRSMTSAYDVCGVSIS